MAKPRSIAELIECYKTELARYFLDPTLPPTQAKCGNVSFIGPDVFSYGSPILRFIRVDDEKKPFLAVAASPYSFTSSKHLMQARVAASSVLAPYIRWTTPMPDCSTTSRYAPEYLIELVDAALNKLNSPRKRLATKLGALASLDRYLDDYELFVAHAGMRTHEQLTALLQGRRTGTEGERIMHYRALAALNA